MKSKQSFPPIVDKKSKVIVLGSMPGEESLKAVEYYANSRNSFWKIMAELFEFDTSLKYDERTKILLKNKIALWDVVNSCERKGSLDSSIKDATIVENDFTCFFREYPNICYIVFNGEKAEREYKKRVLPNMSETKNRMKYHRLPSTSPAMAKMKFQQKKISWSIIKDFI